MAARGNFMSAPNALPSSLRAVPTLGGHNLKRRFAAAECCALFLTVSTTPITEMLTGGGVWPDCANIPRRFPLARSSYLVIPSRRRGICCAVFQCLDDPEGA